MSQDLSKRETNTIKTPGGFPVLVSHLAIFFEHLYEVLSDHLRISSFDVMALNEVDELAVLKEGNRRR